MKPDGPPIRAGLTPFPVKPLTCALILSVIVLVGMAWSALDTYGKVSRVQLRNLRIQELRGTIVHLDEVLTMSARMAAATGDLGWEKRYRKFEPQLDAAAKEAILLADRPSEAAAAAQTDAANLALVEMENRAFGLVRAGQPEQARGVLFSEAYEAQKKIYADGMAGFIRQLNDQLAVSQRQQLQIAIFSVVIVIASILLLLATWFAVLRRLDQWRRNQLSSFERLAEAEEALRHRQAQIQALQDASPLGMFFADATGACIYANRTFEHITGTSSEQVRVGGWRQIIHPEDPQRDPQAWWDASTEGHHYQGIHRFHRPDARDFWASVQTAPVQENGRITGFAGTVEDITERKRGEAELEATHRQLLDASRRAGMAEVASSVLHNVGNVLNSVNTSVSFAAGKVTQMRADGLSRVAALINEHEENLPAFFAEHPQGIRLPKFLTQLAEHFVNEQRTVLGELESLRGNLEHINEIVTMQQSYAGAGGLVETVPLSDVIEDALRMNTAAFARHGTQVEREIDSTLPPVAIDRHKLLLILVNLIRNAKYACDDTGSADKRIIIRTQLADDRLARISVIDNGIGIPAANLARIFEHGFTTRKGGHGFGLHSSALAASEMGGALRVQSEGTGCGATFAIELPLASTFPMPTAAAVVNEDKAQAS